MSILVSLAIDAGIYGLQWLISRYLTPNTVTGPTKAVVPNIPNIVDGNPLPWLYGKIRVRQPSLVWWGNFNGLHTDPQDDQSPFKYGIDMLFSLGIPPQLGLAPASPADPNDPLGRDTPDMRYRGQLLNVYIGDRPYSAILPGGGWLLKALDEPGTFLNNPHFLNDPQINLNTTHIYLSTGYESALFDCQDVFSPTGDGIGCSFGLEFWDGYDSPFSQEDFYVGTPGFGVYNGGIYQDVMDSTTLRPQEHIGANPPFISAMPFAGAWAGISMGRDGVDTSLVPGYAQQVLVGIYASPGSLTGYDGKGGSGAFGADAALGGFIGTYPDFSDSGMGQTAQPPDLSFEVQVRTGVPVGLGTGSVAEGTITDLSSGDANPADVLIDILCSAKNGPVNFTTSPPIIPVDGDLIAGWGKLGLPVSMIDGVTFDAARATLASEGNGYSRHLNTSTPLKQVIAEICEQIAGLVFYDQRTRLVKMKLFRADYNPLSIPQFDTTNVESLEDFATSSWKDTINQARITFNDRFFGYEQGTVVAQNMGQAVAQDGLRSKTFDFPGVCDRANASRIARRELSSMCKPWSKCRMIANRSAATLLPGDVINLSWPDYNVHNRVYRVIQSDQGLADENHVTVDLIEDVFNDQLGGVFGTNPIFVLDQPAPVTQRLVQEAPFHLQQLMSNLGYIPNATPQRLVEVGSPDDNSDQYMGQSRLEFFVTLPFKKDVLQQAWNPRAKVSGSYGQTGFNRELGPYYTPGFIVDTVTNPALLQSSAASDIRTFGYGLAIFKTGEIIAYENFVNIDGTNFLLQNVWRELMDTSSDDHQIGEQLWFFPVTALGVKAGTWQVNQHVDGLVTPFLGSIQGSGEDDFDEVTISGRTTRPSRPAWWSVQGEVMSGTLGTPAGSPTSPMTGMYRKVTSFEEGFTPSWKTRSRTQPTISRADDADETMPDPTTYDILAQVTGVSNAGSEVVINSNIGTVVDATQSYGVAAAGYGEIDVRVRAHTPINTFPQITSWAKPSVHFRAERWRNLLQNPRFSFRGTGTDPGPGWVGTSATVLASTSSISGLASGKYVSGSVNGGKIVQTIDVTGYRARRMDAWLDFFAISLTFTDKVVSKIEALDVSNTVLGTVTDTFTPTASTTWNSRDVVYADLPAGTTQLRVTFTFGGLQTAPTCYVTEPRLRLGQQQVIMLESFDSGTTVGWTNDTNSFVSSVTTGARPSPKYAQGGAFATSQIHQDVPLPTGWEFGDLVLTAWRNQTVTGDTGEITLGAVNGGGTVLGSVNTGLEDLGASGGWVQRRLSMRIPDTAVNARVTLNAVRAGGAGNSTADFDEIRLWIWKDLSEAHYYREALYSQAKKQTVAQTWQSWHKDFVSLVQAGVEWPIVFSGSRQGGNQKGFRSDVVTTHWSDGLVHFPGTAVGQWGNGVGKISSYVFTRGSGASGVDVESYGEGVGTRQMAPKTSESFTCIVIYRSTEDAFVGACGLMGRLNSNGGWGLKINASGQVVAKILGDGGQVLVNTAGSSTMDGCWSMAAIVYDSVAQTVTVYDRYTNSASASTASVGEIYNDDANCPLRIGRAEITDDVIGGDVALAYWFDEALTSPQVYAHWTYGDDPTGASSYSRGASVWHPGPNHSGFGETCVLSGPEQVPIGYMAGLSTLDSVNPNGLFLAQTTVNKIRSFDFTNGAFWVVEGAVTLSQGLVDATGKPLGCIVNQATTSTGLKALSMTFNSTPTATLTFWARNVNANADVIAVDLLNGSDVVKQTLTATLNGTNWKKYVLQFTAWDNSTPNNARVRFKSNSGTISFYLSHVMQVEIGSNGSLVIPQFANSTFTGDAFATVSENQTHQMNAEGEIMVEGIAVLASPSNGGSILSMTNTSNAKNYRELSCDGGQHPHLDHYDSAGPTDVASTATAIDWSQAWQIRGRWCAAKTMDSTTNAFAGVAVTVGSVLNSSYGRTATWTYDTTDNLSLQIGKGSSAAFNCCVRRIVSRAREEKLV